jgi:hypothetical protein
MQCLRCQGLLVAIQMRDMGQPPVTGWRCLLCGATTDPGIEANRASHSQPIRNGARLPGSPTLKPRKGSARQTPPDTGRFLDSQAAERGTGQSVKRQLPKNSAS